MKSPLNAIFRPRAVAVIGASRRSGSIGREILNNLVAGDFQGKVFPVNPNAEVVHSMKCYRSVLEIPDPIDLAVIAVPATEVEAVVDECGRKGIQGLVVITAGFAETGERGRGEEAQLRELCNDHGMRMIGPNCMGVINTDPRHRLNATFSPGRPLAGKVAFLSQSGALGVAILNVARRIGLGVSMFASIGNKADVTAGDLLEYWADDRRTDLILMYLESLGDPAAFTRRARDLSRKKPIVIVKSGRTSAGARAAAGHTGALAGREAFIEALCEQCGLIRVDSIEELFDVGKAIATQPLPAGDRVAVVTNAGGPGIMATDALIAHELEIAPLSEKTREVLRAGLPAAASIINPVDMLADAGVKEYGLTLSAVLQDPGVDAAVVIFVPPIMADPIRVSRRIFREARSLR
ncbi:MAG: acetate--CoA ligase family protein [Planctomycetota bacterium]